MYMISADSVDSTYYEVLRESWKVPLKSEVLWYILHGGLAQTTDKGFQRNNKIMYRSSDCF